MPIAFDAHGERDDARALGELRLEVVVVERRVGAQLDVLDAQVAVVRRARARAPRCRRGRASETRISSPGAKLAPDGAREREVERGHVRAEDHLVRARSRGTRAAFDSASATIAPTRRLVSYGAPMFALASRRQRAIGVADLVGHLAAAGRVEEGEAALQRAEAPPYGGGVERQGRPSVSSRLRERSMHCRLAGIDRQQAARDARAHNFTRREAALAFRVIRTAQASWSGTVPDGGGRIAVGSGAFEGPFTLRARIEEGGAAPIPRS